MNSEQKAMELVNKYLDFDFQLIKEYMPNPIGCAKQCAIIAVDEIIKLRKGYFMCENNMQDEEYWQEVKNHLNQL
jgi:hypothetical protein